MSDIRLQTVSGEDVDLLHDLVRQAEVADRLPVVTSRAEVDEWLEGAHVDPAEEFFFQLEGDMLLRTVQDGHVVDLPIREGEVLLLPPRVPHSPQRYAETVGLVIERERRQGETDAFQWYCEHCENLLFSAELQLTDIETQFPPLFKRFYGNPDNLLCGRCGARMEPPT